MSIESQINKVLREYRGDDIPCALLSGMCLAAGYLAKHDGSTQVTAQHLLNAVYRVGKQKGYEIVKLKDT